MGGKKDPVNIAKSRSCTDILCILLFLVFLGGWVGVGVFGFLHGDPEQLIYPSNSRGEICGRGELADKPSLFFHDLSQCLKLGAVFGCSTPQVCVAECPQKTTSLYAYALYLKNGEGTFDNFDVEYQRQFCVEDLSDDDWNAAKSDGDKLLELINTRKCPSYMIESVSLIGRCIPDFGLAQNNDTAMTDEEGNPIANGDGDITFNKVGDMINYLMDVLNARGFAEAVWSDVMASKWMILAGEGVGVLVAFVWIILMRFVATVMIWLSLLASVALLGLSSAYTWLKYKSFEDAAPGTGTVDTDGFSAYLNIKETWLALFIISVLLLAIILLVTIFLRKRVKLAIALINESSRAVGTILSSLFFPLVTFVLQLGVMAWFVLVCIYLASSSQQKFQIMNGTSTTECPQDQVGESCDPATFNTTNMAAACECVFTQYGPNSLANYLQIYNVFGLFWGLCFVSALGEMVLAGAFSSWYWTLDKDEVPTFAVTNSFGRTLRYHTGTLAFGSLIIAIIKAIRTAIQYIEDKIKEKGADKGPVKVVMCLCKCCLWCLEKFMKFINRNAYILTAVNGSNFCKSAKEAFHLILRNCVRVVVLDKVTDFLLFLGKLVVTTTVALLSFFYFSGGITQQLDFDVREPNLNYYFVPVAIITVGVYFTASCFFSVYAMAVDTMFLCCMVDMEQNDGSRERPYYMSKSLRNILNLKQKKIK